MPAIGAATFWMDNSHGPEALSFRRMPLLLAAAAFGLGESLATRWQPASWYMGALALLVGLTVVALRRSLRVSPVPILALFAVLGGWCAQMEPSPSPQTSLKPYADGLSRDVRGTILRVRKLAPASPTQFFHGEAPPPWMVESGAWEQPAGDAAASPALSVDVAVDAVEAVTPDRAEMVPVSGGVRMTLLDAAGAVLRCGDRIEVPLRLRLPETYRDAGSFDYVGQLLGEGISAHASAHAAALSPGGPQTGSRWTRAGLRCRLWAAQSWASGRLEAFVGSPANGKLPAVARLGAEDAAMLSAMLFGDRSRLRHSLREGFERTGTFHLFVVSGMHVGILAGLAFWLLRRARVPRGPATALTLALATAYAALTGFGVPVQRALLMTAVFLVARLIWRDISILQAIGAAALAVLAMDPRALASASFQMTFLALVAVGGVALPLLERTLQPHIRTLRDLDDVRPDASMHPRYAQRRVMLRLFAAALGGRFAAPLLRRRIREFAGTHPGVSLSRMDRLLPPGRAERMLARLGAGLLPGTFRLVLRLGEFLLVALAVEATMSLPMALYFHRATPFALPSNIFAVPLVAVMAPLALLTFCAALISPWVAVVPAALTALALHAVHALIARLAGVRMADFRVPPPGAASVLLAAAALAFAVWSLHRRHRGLVAAGLLALAVVPLAALYPTAPLLHPGVLEVTALDVGQGDSLLVVTPAAGSAPARTLLVDAGGPVGRSPDPDRFDTGEQVVAPYLWSRHLRRLDAVLLTHAHSDHMGGLPAILRDFRPRELWLSAAQPNSAELRSLLEQAAQEGVSVRRFSAGDEFAWGAVTFSVLSPGPDYANSGAPRNDDSVVMRLRFGGASALLTGDAERSSEFAMLAANRVEPVTLLKVGHHGSRTSTTPDFLAALHPAAAVISDGRSNTFGHPRPEVLERLEAGGTRTWRTDREGARTFLLTPDNRLTTLDATQ